MPSETESSEQTLRDRRVKERATAGCGASTDCKRTRVRRNTHGTESLCETATSATGSAICEMSSFILKLRSLTWTSLTELDRLLLRSVRKYAETIELDTVRRSTSENKDTREGLVAGVKYLLKSLERATGMEDATKKGQVQEFFHKKLQRRPGQPMVNGSMSLRTRCWI